MRIFDVSNPRNPSLIAGVPTDCGSHTHTLVPDLSATRVLLYVASYTASVIPESSFGNKCVRVDENGQRGAQQDLGGRGAARRPGVRVVVSEPRFPQNDRNGMVGYQGCHDITVFTRVKRAAAACMGEGQIWDISRPEEPKTIARVHNPNVEFFHSATFSTDGERVVYGDEAGGGTQGALPHAGRDDARRPLVLRRPYLDNMDATTVERWRSSWKVPRDAGCG